jgi:hypothetical protein
MSPWYNNVAGEAAVDVIAWHFLLAANRAAPFSTKITFAAGQHGRNDDRLANQRLKIQTRVFDDAADFVAERERRRFDRPNSFVEESQIGVTDATTGDTNQYFILGKGTHRNLGTTHRLADLGHLPAVDFAHGRPRLLKQAPVYFLNNLNSFGKLSREKINKKMIPGH